MSDENKEKKNKKISQMTVSEIDSAIRKSAENKLSDNCKYVQHLHQRKVEIKK
jgi:inhibitor of KinA sporulation pathway (predicted exonuclease)